MCAYSYVLLSIFSYSFSLACLIVFPFYIVLENWMYGTVAVACFLVSILSASSFIFSYYLFCDSTGFLGKCKCSGAFVGASFRSLIGSNVLFAITRVYSPESHAFSSVSGSVVSAFASTAGV